MYNIAILGATGLVGQEMLKILEQRNFPVNSLKLLASTKTEGTILTFKGENLKVEAANEYSFKNIDIVLSSAGESISKELVPLAVKEGAIVIDNTNAFRMEPEVPLVVPEVNVDKIKEHKGIIANPNCSTIQLVVVLKPLHNHIPIKRLIVSTYQSVSGAGKDAMNELLTQTKAILNKKNFEISALPKQIAFNLFPHIDKFLSNGYTKEEMKIINETNKIMNTNISITATAVRVPVLIGHSESVNIEFEAPFDISKAIELLNKASGVKVIDDIDNLVYPVPIDVEGKDDVLVGRIRKDLSNPNSINLWIVGDNLRKGAALNAIQIAEKLIEFNLL